MDKKIMVTILLILSVFSISVVSAADNTTDIISDSNGDFSALASEISSGSGEITLNKNYTYSSADGSYKNGIKVSYDNLIIDGNGNTIDGAGSARILNISADNVTLKNIVFKNGFSTGNGGAIISNGMFKTATIINCSFINNKVTGIYSNGGAISGYYTTYYISGCKFINNTAPYGGAISGYLWDDTVITDSIFYNNSYSSGEIYPFTGNIIANYNWWGNNNSNYNVNLSHVYIPVETRYCIMDYWLVLDSSADAKYLDEGETSQVTFTLNKLYNSLSDSLEDYSGSDLPQISLKTTCINGTSSPQTVDLKDGVGSTVFTSNGNESSITASYYTLSTTVSFIPHKAREDSFTSLQELIDDSTGVVNIDKNYYYLEEYDEDYVDGVKINKNLEINGNNYTISGLNGARIFNIQNAAVTIHNITLVNANYTDFGGAIKNTGTLTVYNTTFINNTAYGSAGIDSEGVLTVSDSSFINNSAYSYDAGAISSLSRATITDSFFIANSATRNGGAIKSNSGNITISNCYFAYNTAQGGSKNIYGGAVYIWRSTAEIFNNTMVYNSVLDCGGAIYVGGNSKAKLYDLYVGGNYAYYGGAIYVDSGDITLENITFQSNDGVNGAGFAGGSGNTARVVNSTFSYNYADNYGAVYDTGKLTIINCLIDHSRSEYSSGGGLYVSPTATTTVIDCNFTNNYAYSYGAAIENNGSLYVNHSLFTGNRGYGAGAIDNTGYMEIESCIFDTNTAYTRDGGAISNMNRAKINNSTFINNAAYRNGGAIKNDGSDNLAVITIINSIFRDNFADDGSSGTSWGGAIYNWVGLATIVNSTLISNIASQYGGAFYTGGEYYGYSELILESNLIKDNTAPSGGAVYLDFSLFNATYNAFIDNSNDEIYISSYAITKDINYNWWGVNSPDWLDIITGGNIPTSYAVLYITANPQTVGAASDSDITVGFTWNDQSSENVELIAVRNVSLKTTGGKLAQNNGTLVGSYTTQFTATNTGTYNITAIVDNEKIIIGISVINSSWINASALIFDENATILIEVIPNIANGNVSFEFENKTYNLELVNGKANTTLSNLNVGDYSITINYGGSAAYGPSQTQLNFTIKNNWDVNLAVGNVTKYYGGSQRLIAVLTDYYGNPLGNKTLVFVINGQRYEKTTSPEGRATIGLGLGSGKYTAEVIFNGTEYKLNSANVKASVNILTTVIAGDISKMFKNATRFEATFLDTSGNPLSNRVITFNINGVFYNRTTNENGIARLNINLNPLDYIITSMNPESKENASNNIKVLSNLIENNDLVKYYRNASQYSVKILNDKAITVIGGSVTFNINGLIYTRTTNSFGYAKLNINLQPGEYVITAEYNGCRVSNTIKVLPVLSAGNLTMKYKDGSQFEAKLLDGQGSPLAKAKVTFNINGMIYTKTTDNDGIARLSINLMSGEYIITSSYNGVNVASTITIS